MASKLKELKDRARDKVADLSSDFAEFKTSAARTFNRNHRHDEAHEQARDAALEKIRDGHRFRSFAPVRGIRPEHGADCKWYSDGHDYFAACADALESAKESIMILDWWLSPELYMKRPPAANENWRLDRILQRKAEEGVKIYVIVYKEVTQSMSMDSSHTKHCLEALSQNIAVMRHPDHTLGRGGDIVLVDNTIACIGGLDLCFGRWETHNAPTVDAHPSDFGLTLFPGQDYNSARIKDFVDVERWVDNQQSRLTAPRMPWHDVHCQLVGAAVLDIAQHFCERWNFIRDLKYRRNKDRRYHFLSFPHIVRHHGGDGNDFEEAEGLEAIVRHPDYEHFKEGLQHILHSKAPEDGGHDPHGGIRKKGEMHTQILRSSADWSHGILTECSIQTAYCQMIAESSHCIYIENQFFISAGEPVNGNPGNVKNGIARAIAQRAVSAHRDGKKWIARIVVPCVPGFAGGLKESKGTLAIMDATYRTISRGAGSIYGQLRSAGINRPEDYVQVFHLRSFDRLPDPKIIKEVEQESGVSWDQTQAALSRCYLGDDSDTKTAKLNESITVTEPAQGESLRVERTKDGPERKIALPKTTQEALEILHRFEGKANQKRQDIRDSIRSCVFKGQPSLVDEPWDAPPADERASWVTEELYIHSKLLIVDDRRVLIGSANINERSQLGDRDSEIAVVIEDQDTVETMMAGQSYLAARFAASFRRFLVRQHLGLIKPQDGYGPENDAMRMVGTPQQYDWGSDEDKLVADPLSPELDELLRSTAATNEEIFEKVFHTVPSNQVTDWATYDAYLPKPPTLVGHVPHDLDLEPAAVKAELNKIRGSLVPLAQSFLKDVNMLQLGSEVNPVTIPIYM